MSLRLPQGLGPSAAPDRLNQAFQHEIAAEKAASLGRSGKKLAATLAQLRSAADEGDRATLIKNAAEARITISSSANCVACSSTSPSSTTTISREKYWRRWVLAKVRL